MSTNEHPDFIRLADVPNVPFLARFFAGRPVHLATVYRWVQRGIDGRRLLAIRVGGRGLATTEEWLLEFFSALGHAAPVGDVRTTKQRQRAVERANAELEAAGI